LKSSQIPQNRSKIKESAQSQRETTALHRHAMASPGDATALLHRAMASSGDATML
jgi:hypothetical protein